MPSERQTDLYCALIRRAGSRALFLVSTLRGLRDCGLRQPVLDAVQVRADRYIRLRDRLVKRLAAARVS